MGFLDSIFLNRREHVLSHIAPMLTMMMIDGNVSESEMRVVAVRLAELGVQPAEFEQLMRNPPKIVLPATREARLRALAEVCLVMLADGKIDPRELSLYAVMAHVFGLSPQEATACLAAARGLASVLVPGADYDAELAKAVASLR